MNTPGVFNVSISDFSKWTQSSIFTFQSSRTVSTTSVGDGGVAGVDNDVQVLAFVEYHTHQYRHVGHGDGTVAVEVGVGGYEVAFGAAHDMVDDGRHVADGKFAVAVHVTLAGDGQLETRPAGADGHVGVGMMEGVGIAEEEFGVVVGTEFDGL